MNSRLAAEAQESVRTEFGSDSDWRKIIVRESLLQIVAKVSNNLFLGSELCHEEEWLHCTIHFTTDMGKGM